MAQDNYQDTAIRMCDSSTILYRNKQWLNACYLAGYVVECYGKRMVELEAESGDFEGQATRGFSHHIDNLNEYVKNIAVMGSPLSAYCKDLEVICPVLLSGWNPFTIRYASNSHEWNTEETAEKIYKEMEALADTIIQMQVDGVW